MKKRKLVFAKEGFIILALIIVLLFLVLIPYLKNNKKSSVQSNDLFSGTITNIKTIPGNLSGLGVYDKTCKKIEKELTKCDAGIKTKEYGILNFNYVHNMKLEPCIDSGDKLKVEILDLNGTAKVWRIR